MLSVKNLSVHYGAKSVVSDFNVELGADEILMLVGPTGCGKTTILQALAGLIPISSGEIEHGEWRATTKQAVPPEKRRVGMVFQDFALFPHLTVEENINFRLQSSEQADRWIKLLGLDAFRQQKPATLSGGQKQRVALARTLAHEPSYVLLDEPLSNLDAALKDSLRWEIRKALKAAGVPAIWVTHDQEEALSIGDRLGVLKGGHLEQLDSPERCFAQPTTRFVASFLGDASFLPGQWLGSAVETSVGSAPGYAVEEIHGEVDLLVRPDDFSLTSTVTEKDTCGQITWVRYEGGSRLYEVELDDGVAIKVRTSHEQHCQPGDRVALNINTTHPLAVFNRSPLT